MDELIYNWFPSPLTHGYNPYDNHAQWMAAYVSRATLAQRIDDAVRKGLAPSAFRIQAN